jgi:hypothetical protein
MGRIGFERRASRKVEGSIPLPSVDEEQTDKEQT